MINLAKIDETQHELSRHAAETEKLLMRAVSRISGVEKRADVWLMPDLGVSYSVERMYGGFFTGMVAKWDCNEPFIPVDSTMNVCAVGVYRVDGGIDTAKEFLKKIESLQQAKHNECSYEWNFDSGNHFITLADVSAGQGMPMGRYLVLHSSACEFKSQRNGLYPKAGNWYADRIEVIEDKTSGRHLRFLHGVPAERFFRQARLLIDYNRIRLNYFAETIMEGSRVEEYSYQPHYGMPDEYSVAIGCQWLSGAVPCLLLTAPGEDLLMIEPISDGSNQIRLGGLNCILMPHGLGVSAQRSLNIAYRPDGLQINGSYFESHASLKNNPTFSIRGTTSKVEPVVRQILAVCPGRISAKLRPILTYPIIDKHLLCH